MSAELDLLKRRVVEQTTIYQRCDTSVLPKWRRLLVQAWLSEIGLLVERLQRDVVQLEEGKPSQVGLRQAWSRYWQVFTALSPVALPARADGAQADPVPGLRLVASRLSNRWDTVGFLPWYVTKLIAAPILSLCAVGLLSQVRFANDLSTSTGFANLGLLGASPLLMFSVAILTGLFSNRLFDWLRSVADSTTASRTTTTTTTTNATAVSAGDEGDANG